MKMGRISFVLLVSAILISGSLLFAVSQRVQSTEREISMLKDQLSQENESLRVLKAEWAYLNRPDRLEAMAVSGVLPANDSPATLQRKIHFNLGVVPTPSRKPSGFLPSPQKYTVSESVETTDRLVPVQPLTTTEAEKNQSFDTLLDTLEGGHR